MWDGIEQFGLNCRNTTDAASIHSRLYTEYFIQDILHYNTLDNPFMSCVLLGPTLAITD